MTQLHIKALPYIFPSQTALSHTVGAGLRRIDDHIVNPLDRIVSCVFLLILIRNELRSAFALQIMSLKQALNS